jgi:peptidoglycan/LPS O-acetylase OafA/YrhL
MKALRVLSIIGFVWYIIWFVVFSDGTIDQETGLGCATLAFGYAIAHGIVAIVQGTKWKKRILTVMSIIGFVLYVLGFSVIATAEDYESAYGWYIIGAGYAIAFGIVTLVISIKTLKKPTTEQV